MKPNSVPAVGRSALPSAAEAHPRSASKEIELTVRNPTYLSAGGRLAAARITAEHRRYFRLFSRCAVFTTDLLFKVRVKQGERQKVVCVLLLARLLESAQAAALLRRSGLERDAAANCRVVLETFVYLVGCSLDHEFVDEYVASQLRSQLKLARGGLQLTDLEPDLKERLERQESRLTVEADKFNARDLKVEAVARRFDLIDDYQTVYRLTSPSVHTSPRVLQQLAAYKAGKVSGITYGPSDKYTDVHLFSLSEYLLRAASHVATLCGEDIEIRRRQLYSQLRRLQPEWPEELGAANPADRPDV